ncbi:retron Ec67 family RNA-directed DNA polymerase/endonuclease [Henriciella marina]|uniref:RNA-directed DNA polymerase n=1 Tax=Henriciella marina TaxID=453851 RepID=A0ABT4LVC1_9PROT|nr:retron Ec67 family RNA-directed DNA polymerase/endonuclease [Henriciella marina]MCZ4298301.1 retron Ec67 family RNA-directed DNA polymerase/endonuclease [Henriciella marina]
MPASQSSLSALKSATSLSDFAHLIGVKPQWLSYVMYVSSTGKSYSVFERPKKSGGMRTISAPNGQLKNIQKRTAVLLAKCHADLRREKFDPSRALQHGIVKSRGSINTNALKHIGKKFVFNIDLKNFYGSINFGRVRGFFISDSRFRLRPEIATLIAQICCYENSLPQGAPTSPIISEFLGNIIDSRLNRLARKHKCTYSRYADDITFSTNVRVFPRAIAKRKLLSLKRTWAIGRALRRELKLIKFAVNPAKTRMQCKRARQMATGLIVNEKLNVPCEYRKRTRAMCHSLFTTGEAYTISSTDGVKVPLSLPQVRGRMSFEFSVRSVEYVDSSKGNIRPFRDFKKAKEKAPEFYRRYRNLLLFEMLHANEMPTILCEGKTDNVYLKCALQKLAPQYPKMISSSGERKVRFFNYSTTTDVLLGLSGGIGGLKNFLETLRDAQNTFEVAPTEHPLIILVDNDAAAKSVWSVVKSILNSHSAVDGSAPHYKIFSNTFVVPIPKVNPATPIIIEELFPLSVLNTKLNGKVFNPHNPGGVSSKEYGKWAFAKNVVVPSYKSIDFLNFKPLLDNIDALL